MTDLPGALTLACGQLAEVPAAGMEVSTANVEEPAMADTIARLFEETYAKDPVPNTVLEQLRRGQTRSKQLSLTECRDDNNRLVYHQWLYIPDYMPLKLWLIRDFHEAPAVGHPGWSKTLELLARQYYWPRMHKDVDQFLYKCHTC